MNEMHPANGEFREAVKHFGLPYDAPEVVEARAIVIEAVDSGYSIDEAIDFVRPILNRALADRHFARV